MSCFDTQGRTPVINTKECVRFYPFSYLLIAMEPIANISDINNTYSDIHTIRDVTDMYIHIQMYAYIRRDICISCFY